MREFVYVYTEVTEMHEFRELLLENGYTYERDSPCLHIFRINIAAKSFIRLNYTAERCITVEEFIDLFL